MLIFKLIAGFYRDIRNYFMIGKIVDRESKLETWKKFNLRVDWINRIYTVLNLRKEDMGEPELVQKVRLMEIMDPINDYLTTLGLQQIVKPRVEYIPSNDPEILSLSWLVVWSPLPYWINLRNIMAITIRVILFFVASFSVYILIRLLLKEGILQFVYDWVSQIIS